MIKEIAFTVYPAKDVAKMREFYRENLGLRFGQPFEENGTLKYDEANVGDGTFAVMTETWVERPAGSAGSVVFEVDDLEKMRTDLIAKGIAVDDIVDFGVCTYAAFSDPEGNKVSLHQRAAGR
ncbi:MAG: VOC family protein [Candidatus Tyrphobacter sp.]